ncbi:hypothetical protein EW146_g1783 [Bondarzewia mesenterica]|uniref:Ras GEF n=1 Tax=Bondarzewia mesenterica TaxID=1095465 RepID=A0A4S4M519_9AGAM|nr:hypothetical protein EW146_g1783 [Bondarzewia mesenterica]
MAASSSQLARQSLRLLIDPKAPLFHVSTGSSATPTSSPLSGFRKGTWSYESPSGESYERMYSVSCLYDFQSADTDHLSFRKHEILDIVRQEDSGWWAAVRRDGSGVGWIPASYVRPLPEDTVDKVYHLKDDTQIPLYHPDRISRSAPPSLKPSLNSPLSSTLDFADDDDALDTNRASFPEFFPEFESSQLKPEKENEQFQLLTDADLVDSPVDCFNAQARRYPPSPLPPLPEVQLPLRLDKSLPTSPQPLVAVANSPQDGSRPNIHGRSASNPSLPSSDSRSLRRRPLLLDDQSSLQRLSALIQGHDINELEDFAYPHPERPLDSFPHQAMHLPRPGKVKQLTGDDDAQAFHNAKLAQANLPWYLRPGHGDDEIKVEFDGSVRAGTLSALVERLVVDSLKLSQQETFRRVFLTTFRTFATANEVYDLLISHYEMTQPEGLDLEALDVWKKDKMRPTQKRVLSVLTLWLEEHDMLNQDPDIPPRLQAFLSQRHSAPSLSLTAKHMLISLERLTFADPNPPEVVTPLQKRWKNKVRKYESYELLRMDPLDIAQHLCALEHKLYARIRPTECLAWSKQQSGNEVKNMEAFCSTHTKLADWVKSSILEVEGLSKRASTVDFWIRVAEKCKSLNNFSSMTSIVAALSSSVIARLHFTWVHATRESHLEPLLKFNAPAGNYAYYRSVLDTINGPCVPFIGMYMRNMVHIDDQHGDYISIPSASSPGGHRDLIHFIKRHKWYDVAMATLRFQSKSYAFAENQATTSFIRTQMANVVGKEERWFWNRSEELQQAELVHADIRKGLEAAGF